MPCHHHAITMADHSHSHGYDQSCHADACRGNKRINKQQGTAHAGKDGKKGLMPVGRPAQPAPAGSFKNFELSVLHLVFEIMVMAQAAGSA